MKFTIAAVAVAAVAAEATLITPALTTKFGDFMVAYNKTYSDDEIADRIDVFARNMELADERNKENILAGGEAIYGVTKFSDISNEEFRARYLTYVPDETVERFDPEPVENLAAKKDWRGSGALTPIKDQGDCGSCWAFSATEAIESYYKLKTGKLLELSAQQLNSCASKDGCDGGRTETAYQYVKRAGGIEKASDYPYTSGRSGKSGTCKFNKSKVAVKISGFKKISKGESNLKQALNSGPVAICLDSGKFDSYTGGIVKACGNHIDHCVQAVGYDTSQNVWLVRNQWGRSWGEKGYMRIAMGKNLCKIADNANYPTF